VLWLGCATLTEALGRLGIETVATATCSDRRTTQLPTGPMVAVGSAARSAMAGSCWGLSMPDRHLVEPAARQRAMASKWKSHRFYGTVLV
jgi:hypothetical protein